MGGVYSSTYIGSNYKLDVPAFIQVEVDGVKLEPFKVKETEEGDRSIYKIKKIFCGLHDVTISSEYTEKEEREMEVKSGYEYEDDDDNAIPDIIIDNQQTGGFSPYTVKQSILEEVRETGENVIHGLFSNDRSYYEIESSLISSFADSSEWEGIKNELDPNWNGDITGVSVVAVQQQGDISQIDGNVYLSLIYNYKVNYEVSEYNSWYMDWETNAYSQDISSSVQFVETEDGWKISDMDISYN